MSICKWKGLPEKYDEGVDWWRNIFNWKERYRKHNLDILIIIALDNKSRDCIGHVIFYQGIENSNQWLLSDLKISYDYRLNGVATNMIKTGIEKIKSLSGKEIISFIDKDNHPSINLHKKIGFEKSGYEKFDDIIKRENENSFKLELSQHI